MVMGDSTGTLLLGKTATVNACVALIGGRPLSDTTTARLLVPTCARFGVHRNRPFEELMLALNGELGGKLNVNELGGLSASVALLVKARVIPTPMV